LFPSIPCVSLSEKPIFLRPFSIFLKPLASSNQSGCFGNPGLSLYPHHLKDNTNCTVESFCEMVAKTAEIMELKNIGIGSDLCLDQPDTVVEWMRNVLFSAE